VRQDDQLPFDVALRRAVDARRLSLDRIAKRLRVAATPVSTATLSNWQRGKSTPKSSASWRAVAQLETVLELPAGALVASLTPYAGVSRQVPTRKGSNARSMEQLRASFGTASDDLVIVRHDEYAVVGPRELRREVRMTARAERTGVDRTVVILHPDVDTHVDFNAGSACRLGAIRRRDQSGLVAAELIFGASLIRGEFYPVSYWTSSPLTEATGYVVKLVQSGLASYSLTVEFDATAAPPYVYQVWRATADTPHKRLADLRLVGGRYAHIWLHNPPPGTHGIRWDPGPTAETAERMHQAST